MSVFNDEDLKRLKESINDERPYINVGDDEYGDPDEHDLKALLARLSAAEAYIDGRRHLEIKMEPKERDLLQAWLRSKGESK